MTKARFLARLLSGCVAVAVLASGCSGGVERQALLTDTGAGVSTWGFTPNADEILLVGTAPLRVLDEVTFESAALEMESGELELLEARVSLFACRTCRRRSDVAGYAGYAGSSCSYGPWPPAGYGPTEALAGFEVAPGDRPSILLYMKARSSSALSRAVVVTYRSDGRRQTLEMANERIEVEPTNDPKGDHCEDSLWFGGTANPDVGRVQPLTPTAEPR